MGVGLEPALSDRRVALRAPPVKTPPGPATFRRCRLRRQGAQLSRHKTIAQITAAGPEASQGQSREPLADRTREGRVERRRKGRLVVSAVLALLVGGPVCGALAQSPATAAVRRACTPDPAFDRGLEELVRSQPPQHRAEARELQALVQQALRDNCIAARKESGDLVDFFHQQKEMLRKQERRFTAFIERARSPELRDRAKIVRDGFRPLVAAMDDGLDRFTTAGLSAGCLAIAIRTSKPPSPGTLDARLQASFRKEILRFAAAITNGDWEAVLDATEDALLFVHLIGQWSEAASREFHRGEMLVNHAVALQYRRKGDRTDNVERSIEGLKMAEEAFGRISPQESKACGAEVQARIRLNRGAAYWSRIKGERAENLELAMATYQEALSVLTRDAFPNHWAVAQNNLGLVLAERVRGRRAKNIDDAIDAYQAAMKVQDPQKLPAQSIMLKTNLARAYVVRERGNREENIERAIDILQEALSNRDSKEFRSPLGELAPSINPVLQCWRTAS